MLLGPRSPGMNIDVYLMPLIDELKELWEKGVQTLDEKVKKNFKLHSILLWTINDFPACPYCHKDELKELLGEVLWTINDFTFWLDHKRKICMSILPQGYRLFEVEIWVQALLHGTSTFFCPWIILCEGTRLASTTRSNSGRH